MTRKKAADRPCHRRLIDDSTKRVVQTRVTDKAGRIFFFVGKGTYRLEALKPGYAFPSTSMAGEREDGNFANLYFGQSFGFRLRHGRKSVGAARPGRRGFERSGIRQTVRAQ